MDLKDFVAQTLVQIVDGVAQAQKQTSDRAGISPIVASNYDHAATLGFIKTTQGQAPVVKFDVAISASSGQEGKAGGSIKVLSVFSLGGEATASDSQSSVSRVQFAVPVVLPGAEACTTGPSSPMPTQKKRR